MDFAECSQRARPREDADGRCSRRSQRCSQPASRMMLTGSRAQKAVCFRADEEGLVKGMLKAETDFPADTRATHLAWKQTRVWEV